MIASATTNLKWFKATLSTSSSNCVEVARVGGFWLIRDSKYLRDPHNDAAKQPMISVPDAQWREFLDAVLEPNGAGRDGLPRIGYRSDGSVSISAGRVTLTYTRPEWDAFRDGIERKEFDFLSPAA